MTDVYSYIFIGIAVLVIVLGAYYYWKSKQKHVTLNIHSSKHVVDKPKSVVLGMAKPTDAQKLRVIHHREREKRNGQSSK